MPPLFRKSTGPGADIWASMDTAFPVISSRPHDARKRLRDLAQRFLQSTRIEGAGGLEVDDYMRACVALQACLPVLNLGLDWYRDWSTVVLYPAGFVARHSYEDESGVVHEEERALSGESWQHGPIVLSWEDAIGCAHGELEGNVVIHECAHKLDYCNGAVNGMPALHPGMDRRVWTRAFSQAFDSLRARLDAGEHGWPCEYAGEDAPEFFAVMSEAFFTSPAELNGVYPQVYEQLELFYKQHPLDGRE